MPCVSNTGADGAGSGEMLYQHCGVLGLCPYHGSDRGRLQSGPGISGGQAMNEGNYRLWETVL